MAECFYGRLSAYEPALLAGDVAALTAASTAAGEAATGAEHATLLPPWVARSGPLSMRRLQNSTNRL